MGNSEGWQRASMQLLANINFTADPCEDFFEFSCGRWLQQHPIPSDVSSYGRFPQVIEKVDREMNSGRCALCVNSQWSSETTSNTTPAP